jgi:hypothetical protein
VLLLGGHNCWLCGVYVRVHMQYVEVSISVYMQYVYVSILYVCISILIPESMRTHPYNIARVFAHLMALRTFDGIARATYSEDIHTYT